MAVAGGATSAYLVHLNQYGVFVSRPAGMVQRSQCAPVSDAVYKIIGGEKVLVAGADVERVRVAVANKFQSARGDA